MLCMPARLPPARPPRATAAMHLDPRLLVGWTRDVALAYVGGLALGAPFAPGAVWLTGTERAATACLVLAMTGLLIALRRSTATVPASPQHHPGHRTLPTPSPAQSRVA